MFARRSRSVRSLSARAGVVAAYVAAAITLSATAASAQVAKLVVTEDSTIPVIADSPLRMPTDVTVSGDGQLYVADGASDRIAIIDPASGRTSIVSEAEGRTLSRPVGVATDGRGRVWIADTGNARVIRLDGSGRPERTIDLNPLLATGRGAVTDLAVPGEGDTIWLVDNHGHRVIRFETASGTATTGGSLGEPVGRFHYPFLIAASTSDPPDFFVSDVLNGRIAIVSAKPEGVGACGEYGLDPGMLYRPKGVAVDRAGLVWAADSVMGVVQAFRADGRFVDVVRDSRGAVVRFDAPVGLAFDGEDRLLVVELTPGRVRRLQIRRESVEPTGSRPLDNRPSMAPRQPRDCTACHVEWIPPLGDGRASELIEPPPNTRERPAASRGEMCLSCHDGSVVDSRRRVWFEHGHATGVTPPAGMNVPKDLPLVAGALDCRTCHSAHSRGGSGHSIATAVFLRVDRHAGELCLKCHTDMSSGPASGMHPVAVTAEWPIPSEITAASSRLVHDDGAGACFACHQGHGSRTSHLLHDMPGDRLCLSCHEQTHPAAFVNLSPLPHPLSTRPGEAVAYPTATSADSGAPPDRLGCLSCHQMHHAVTASPLLTVGQGGSALCVSCHAEQKTLVGSVHDLRMSAPTERNARGQSCDDAGPCSACHAVHSVARAPAAAPGDAAGHCSSCHSPGGCAAAKSGQPFGHPTSVAADLLAGLATVTGARRPAGAAEEGSLNCISCHNPHGTAHPAFLGAAPDDLCATCHAAQAATLAGAHDFTDRPDLRNARSRTATEAGRCGFCHSVHAPHGGSLSVATASTPVTRDDGCIQCHGADRSAMAGALMPLMHPAGAAACADCHDPHGHSGRTGLMRVDRDGDRRSSCFGCHADTRGIDAGPHGAGMTGACASQLGACGPCHTAHAPAGSHDRGMWNVPLGTSLLSMAEGKCTGCHSVGGCARQVAYRAHPALPMVDQAVFHHVGGDQSQGSGMPLFALDGSRSSTGVIACATCHNPHGPPAGREVAEDPVLRRASKPMLRSFEPPNACTSCHGFDALQRYLHFHRRSAAAPNN